MYKKNEQSVDIHTKTVWIGDNADDSLVVVLHLLVGEMWRQLQPRPTVDYHRVYAGIVLHQRRVPHAGPAPHMYV